MAPQKNQMFRPAKEDGEFVPLQRVFHQILGRGPPLKMKKCKKDVVRVRVFWIPYEVLLNNKKAKILRGCLYRRFLFKFIG